MKLDYYSKDVLKTIQRIELSILLEFDKICKENGLDYFLGGGSAIGAIRHQGFIPWDDDIDVNMCRKDYDKFLKIAAEQYSDKYTIVNNDTNPDFPLMNTRWGLNGTEYKTEDLKDLQGDFGIFLDIFCFDNIPDDDKLMKKQGTKAWIYGKLLVLSKVKCPTLYYYGITKKILSLVFYLAHYFLVILHLKPRFFYKRAYAQITKYNDIETKRFAYMFDPKRFTSIINKTDVYPTRIVKFEGHDIKVAKNVEKYLERRFGDYMQLPPEDKRHIHPPYNLDFGKYADEEQKNN
ncbi:lipopolysaccharide cholinephosphotransferase [Kandleria vitulina]|uniref:Lipopolysaccharide cholinephosphotransferase n=1 Tax=Kandleria vitulina TaxID=1630 RepID=A0A1H2TVQ0_9FIRM|nr:LicD family protein [Kandleria vitulina]SDW47975.1 lipopolysaccharide cholinephosphotransferase [Kandleria vitulina]